MQQPLGHLYFLTLLEHIQAKNHVHEYKLSYLVTFANTIAQQLKDAESIALRVEIQAVMQLILQELAKHLKPSELRMVQPLKDDINR